MSSKLRPERDRGKSGGSNLSFRETSRKLQRCKKDKRGSVMKIEMNRDS